MKNRMNKRPFQLKSNEEDLQIKRLNRGNQIWLGKVTGRMNNHLYRLQLIEINLFIIEEEENNQARAIFEETKADDNEMYFDEQYSVAMFYIIEFLARRKATHPDSLYYMNQYLTVESEKGVFANKTLNQSDKQISQDILEKENKIFRSSNINTVPDNNIDQVLERVYETLKKRLS